jgi:octaprenyl-diphosphate synthase
LGIDIKEKKMTLPLIYALNNSDWLERRKIINIVKNESEKPKKVREVIEFVKSKGGLDYATSVMESYSSKAIQIIKELPQNQATKHLEGLVEFTINRKI